MKLVLLLSALVVLTHQQFQYRSRPRGLVWLSSYSPQRIINNYQPGQLYNDYYQNEMPYPIHSRPSTRIGEIVTYYKNEELNPDVIISNTSHDNEDDQRDVESLDTQARINFYQQQNAGRFFGSSTINNPFIKTATFTLSSTVTTVGSIVICVPANNLVAVPSPTCSGRKRRSDEDEQFPITPTETLSLVPTAVARETRDVDHQDIPSHVISSQDDYLAESSERDVNNSRDKRFFGGGVAATKTVTSYSFVGATLTSTVILDPTGANVAVCLPAGYIVCA